MILRYEEKYSRKKFKVSYFYIVVAFCFLIIGGASWFAVSNFKESTAPETPSKTEYQDKTSSYTESEEKPQESLPQEEVVKPVESEPYSSVEEVTPEAPLAFSMPVEGEVIKDFSRTNLQYSSTYGDMRLHTAVDIACETGTKVSSAADGTVLSVEETLDYGTVVAINHGSGITVKYSALKDIKVKAGDKVKVGDIIAAADTVPSECNDKPHIHIEVLKDSVPVSPLEILN